MDGLLAYKIYTRVKHNAIVGGSSHNRKALNSGNETNIKFRTANKQDEMRKLTDDDDDDKQSVSRGSKHFKDLCLEFY
ncbi:hypothetical protein BLOT_006850 [Blomia tropicalis]|nr:hypothetical protein BLOT_006850 [Blomia tropicalis]